MHPPSEDKPHAKPAPAAPVDPHPSREEHYDRIPHPGGVPSRVKDIGPNPAVHDGSPQSGPDSKRSRQTP